MRELEAALQQFGELLLRAQLAKGKTAPYRVRWVRRFLTQPASSETSSRLSHRIIPLPQQADHSAIAELGLDLRIPIPDCSSQRKGPDRHVRVRPPQRRRRPEQL